MRIGISGLGNIGKRHLELLSALPPVDVVAAVEPRLGGDASAAGMPLSVYGAFDEMLEKASLDAVVIASPSGMHAEQGAAAAEVGVHVITEKPLATTMGAAESLVAACASRGVRLAVVHQYRFHAPLVRLKKEIDGGALGKVVFLNVSLCWRRSTAYYAENGGWRGTWKWDGGGALMNQGSHAVDLARWLVGPIATVTALTTNVVHAIEGEDTACVALEFARGGLGMLQVTTCSSENRPAVVTIEGTEGAAVVRGEQLAVNGRPVELRSEHVRQVPLGNPHRLQFEAIFDALANGERPPVAGDESRETLAATLAMYESARSGRAIRVPESRLSSSAS
ncbi:MAG: Gfo/Idh/MocA family oxidoreductase [Gaiellaceae bacterium MAG52_C11]|nr:Gfo/Idh/MocA family oxidoreductase [Candidatus Gaiellasilicea maunaloa]